MTTTTPNVTTTSHDISRSYWKNQAFRISSIPSLIYRSDMFGTQLLQQLIVAVMNIAKKLTKSNKLEKSVRYVTVLSFFTAIFGSRISERTSQRHHIPFICHWILLLEIRLIMNNYSSCQALTLYSDISVFLIPMQLYIFFFLDFQLNETHRVFYSS